MKKKVLTSCLGILSCIVFGAITFPSTVSASNEWLVVSSITEEDGLPNVLTFDRPTDISNRGYSFPTKKWTGGKYNIPQTAIGNGNTVYSNYYFAGKSSYGYYFHNTGTTTMTIKLRNISSHAIYKTITLKSGQSTQATLKTQGNWYAQFNGGKDFVFSGWIN